MLTYTTPEALAAEPPARRFLHVVLLTALRDQAERLELRHTDDGSLLYYRVRGRDWELIPPPDEVEPELADEVRAASKLVSPDRPEQVITWGVGDARYVPTEVGWLTYKLGGYWVDLVVQIDPRRPWGGITFEVGPVDDMAAAAGDALAALADLDAEE